MKSEYDFVVYSVADWQVPFRTRYLIEAMAEHLRESKFLYVERPICLLTSPLRHFHRYMKRIRHQQPRQITANLFVYQPYLFLHDHIAPKVPGTVQLNRHFLAGQLKSTIGNLNMRGDSLIVWISDPFQEEYLDVVGEKVAIYDCFDEYTCVGEKSFLRTSEILEKRERRILSRVDIVLVASEELFKIKGKEREDIHLVPNAVDTQNFMLARSPATKVAEKIAKIPNPIIGYIGTINARTDFQLVVEVARSRPHWSIVFVGPYAPQHKDFFSLKAFQEAKSLSNVHFLGGIPYEMLPHYLKAFDVCMMPYTINQFNWSCSPLKIYEYLATGKPIVATDLPAARMFSEVVRIAADYESFIRQIEQALRENDEDLVRKRLAIAQLNSWEVRAERIVNIVDAQLRK